MTDSTAQPARNFRAAFGVRIIQTLGVGVFLLMVVAFFSFTTPYFLTWTNSVNVLSAVSVIGIVALGQVLVIISGGFDLSVSGTLPLGAVLYALMVNAGIDPILATALVMGAGAIVGLLNGILVTQLGISPLIATLGTLSITGGLAYTFSDGVTIPIRDLADAWLADFALPGISWYLVVFAVLSGLLILALRHSTFGRMLYAVGGNPEASHLAGIRVNWVVSGVYILCAMLASLAGIVVASQLLAGSATVGANAALSSIAAVVLGGASLAGGAGSVGGTLIGVLILGVIANGMTLLQVPAFYQQIATGVVLLLGVIFSRIRDVAAEK